MTSYILLVVWAREGKGWAALDNKVGGKGVC
jgi:hypothetical protein